MTTKLTGPAFKSMKILLKYSFYYYLFWNLSKEFLKNRTRHVSAIDIADNLLLDNN